MDKKQVLTPEQIALAEQERQKLEQGITTNIFDTDKVKQEQDTLKEDIKKKEEITNLLKTQGKKAEDIDSFLETYTLLDKSKIDDEDSFFNEINSFGTPISTGFKCLDGLMQGGLRTGIYVINGVSGIGKSSFILQLAENLSSNNNPVLYYALEMSKTELVSKIVSRNTLKKDDSKELPHNVADDRVESIDILDGKYIRDNDTTKQETIKKAYIKFKNKVKDNLCIIDELDSLDNNKLEESITIIKELKGTYPIVIIDYLQFLGIMNQNENKNPRDIIDELIAKIKRLVVKYNLKVILLSSVARSQYEKVANLGSGKESGGIEYTGNYVIQLEPDFIKNYIKETSKIKEYEDFRQKAFIQHYEENKRRNIPVGFDGINLKILKARVGRKGTINLEFYGRWNHFEEMDNGNNKKYLNGSSEEDTFTPEQEIEENTTQLDELDNDLI